jgi:hypothetical protein
MARFYPNMKNQFNRNSMIFLIFRDFFKKHYVMKHVFVNINLD